MSNPMSTSVLSCTRRRLVELMQETNFGRIENLSVREGEPEFDPPPLVVRLFVFGKDNEPNASRLKDGFALKSSVAELFQVLDREQSLLIRELVIGDGLPIRMSVAAADSN